MNIKRQIIGGLAAVLIVTGLIMLPLQTVEATGSNIGYVSEEVYEVHPAVVEFNQEMQEQMNIYQQEFNEQTSGLDQQEDAQQIQQIQQQIQQQFQHEQAEKQEELLEKVEADLEQVREELGLELILHEEMVVSGGEDITEEVKDYFENM
ncbi:OmpH family outer membrane protein [Natroniella sulfidigena]|uniref:OmpH family outer membrane protein n=1 Tax=Natroniella sulfidigena TaxID=723921 RepID=UPI00200AB6D7|nr:OmpH family outer membrane protein [Natroniella sulfidigena]MCK8817646.1 OmpH family outer membrane protein [Natroniella sulfidigena]